MRILLRYWKTITISGVILYASLVRTPHFALPPIAHSDKWAHGVMYLLLGAVWLWELLRSKKTTATSIIAGLTYPILFGGLIEIMQEQFFYPRTGDWKDWIADIVGTCTGVALTYKVWQIKKN